MVFVFVDFEVFEELGAESVLREHAFDGVLDEASRVLFEDFAHGFVMSSAGVS